MNNASLVKIRENLCMLKVCKWNADLYGLTTKIYFLVALHEFKLNSVLIVVETNQIIVSLIPFHFPLPVNLSCFAAPIFVQAPRLASAFRFVVESFSGCQRSIVAVTTAKKDGKAEIGTLDPWSGKLLCWSLDHATPLLFKEN